MVSKQYIVFLDILFLNNIKWSFQNFDKGNDTDEWALSNGYVSIVPVQYDITAYDYISELKSWNL